MKYGSYFSALATRSRKPLNLVKLNKAVAEMISEEKSFMFHTEQKLFKPNLNLEIRTSPVSSSNVRLAHVSIPKRLIYELL